MEMFKAFTFIAFCRCWLEIFKLTKLDDTYVPLRERGCGGL